jgi:hypothetical protein
MVEGLQRMWHEVTTNPPPQSQPVWVSDGKSTGCSEFTTDWAYCDDVRGPITHWQGFPNAEA